MDSVWLKPAEIEEVWAINNRSEDKDHIESLSVSMTTQGYLPEYPLIVFRAEGLGLITDKSYVLACGHHRRKAAIKANIETVFCEVHSGDEDAWIEIMSTDNFQFDVSQGGVGKAFTEVERRAACRQLLLLPKYLQMTNVALGAQWNVPESTVRRWRNEMVNAIVTTTEDIKSTWYVSDDRLKRLKDVIANPKRLNEAGEAVTATRNQPDDSIEARNILWRSISRDATENVRSDGKSYCDRHGIGHYDFRKFTADIFGVENSYEIAENTSIRDLKVFHNKIMTNDPELVKQYQDMIAEEKAWDDASEETRSTYYDLEKLVAKKIAKTVGTHDGIAQRCWSHFRKAVKENFEGFDVDKARADAESVEQFHNAKEMLDQLIDDVSLGNKVAWIKAFRAAWKVQQNTDRTKKENAWLAAREKMFSALAEYPRDVSERAFCTAMEDQFWGWKQGSILATTSPSELSEDTLKDQAADFKRATTAIAEDSYWVARIRAVDDQPKEDEPVIEYLSMAFHDTDGRNVVTLDKTLAIEYLSPEQYKELIEIMSLAAAAQPSEVPPQEPEWVDGVPAVITPNAVQKK
jgi:hypothetical protein